MCFVKEVYCWHCGKKFEKRNYRDGSINDFEKCPYCNKGFNELSLEAQKAVKMTLKGIYEETIKKKEFVVWISGEQTVVWRPKRTPKLGWTDLTLLEALSDSAKTLLALGNIEDSKKQLNKILKILRNKIEKEKRRTPQTLLKTCEYRETNRTRCNRFPTKFNVQTGQYLCEKHYLLKNKK